MQSSVMKADASLTDGGNPGPTTGFIDFRHDPSPQLPQRHGGIGHFFA